MRIGIVAWSLLENMGGLERVCCDLASAMLSRGHQVTLLCNKAARHQNAALHPLPEGCGIEMLRLTYSTAQLDDAKKQIRKYNLDVLCALFSWESLLWFPALLQGSGIPLVISEHSKPEWINSKWNAYERHCCLECADSIHVLLQGFVQEYPEHLHGRIQIIPNPAPALEGYSKKDLKPCRKTILSAGRFAENPKQFSLLLKAFAPLKDRFPDWDLEICGDGPSMGDYLRLSETLGLGKRLRLPGMVSNITSHYAAGDIFCIPSRVEGFGMVTVEAQSLALPAVGFADCSGVNEVIVHGENGFLAEEMTPACLARHLATLMNDAELRQRLGERGKAMLDRYAPQKVYDAWEGMLYEAAKKKGRTRIQEIESLSGEQAPEIMAAKELLGRKHPFDRSNYLKRFGTGNSTDTPCPFTEKELAGFMKKQKKFGFPGYTSPVEEIKRFARRLGACFYKS